MRCEAKASVDAYLAALQRHTVPAPPAASLSAAGGEPSSRRCGQRDVGGACDGEGGRR